MIYYYYCHYYYYVYYHLIIIISSSSSNIEVGRCVTVFVLYILFCLGRLLVGGRETQCFLRPPVDCLYSALDVSLVASVM